MASKVPTNVPVTSAPYKQNVHKKKQSFFIRIRLQNSLRADWGGGGGHVLTVGAVSITKIFKEIFTYLLSKNMLKTSGYFFFAHTFAKGISGKEGV